MAKKLNIPQAVLDAFKAYGHTYDINTAVAFRDEPAREWCAILFNDEDAGEFIAVGFQRNVQGEWEVDDDGIGPFTSVREFSTEELVDKWF